MSKPRGESVVDELIAALQSLHMEPEELPLEEQPDDELYLMDERLKWVAHARKHIHSALKAYQKEGGSK